ncbi:sensor domain-containing protein [Halorubrum lipolyticum]|uniref:Two-component system sensor kinase n=1 Tax=Halorubrum lipolyticum DSM 21995 TaxID=1227482 RepID=M0P0Y4_9EURY|nr:sensor domain-containing protein [Halorubrum lipolyticum]EMA62455.1 two-component system sensor kinase [Halorubrum lipolyticum DSM 21995]
MVSLRSPSALPVVGVLVDGRTYRHLLYLLLAIPLGFLYSMLFSFGFVFGLLLSVVLVGFVVLLATLLGARIAAGFERWLADRLLGTDLERYDDVPADTDGAVAGVRKYVDAASTWRGVGFLLLKYFVTVLAFVPLVALAAGLPLVLAPLRYPYVANFGESNGEPVTWAIDTLPEALLAVLVGVVAVLVALHVTNLVAYVCRQMATALLGEPTGDGSGTVRESVADDGSDSATSDAGPSKTGDSAESDAPPTGDDAFIPADAVEPDSDAVEQNSDAVEQNSDAVEQNSDAVEQNSDAVEQNSDAVDRNSGDGPVRDDDRA